jgi:hypothetical protein
MELKTTFDEAIQPYRGSWDKWVASDYCVLTEREVAAAELYYQTGSLAEIAGLIRRKEATAIVLLQRVTLKLKCSLSIYTQWLSKHVNGEEKNEDYPLHVPLKCLPLSSRLKNILYASGDTLHEVLTNNSGGELYQYRGFGKVMMDELQEFLAQNGFTLEQIVQEAGPEAAAQPSAGKPTGS